MAPPSAPAVEAGRRSVSILLVVALAAVTVGPAVLGAPGLSILLGLALIGGVLWRRREGPRALGFARPTRWGVTVGQAVLLGGALYLLSAAVVDPALEALTGTPLDLSAFEGLRGNLGALLMWLGIVWVLVVFVEEVIYRGFLMNELRRVLGDGLGGVAANLGVSSVLFGLVHWYQGPSGVLSSGLIGLALGVAFIRSGYRLWLPLLAHGVIDTLALGAIYSGVDRHLAALW